MIFAIGEADMSTEFDLEQYLNQSIENLIMSVAKSALKNPKESVFLSKFALASARAKKLRAGMAQQGEHIPAFLIASITSECNLHCVGCYARANHSCEDKKPDVQLGKMDWDRIFNEAAKLGVCFILLAGGEPLMRRDIIEQAAKYSNIIFPVFTNGTMIDVQYLELFDAGRNLVPILSIEGGSQITDTRRGAGVYRTLMDTAENLQQRGVLFGASITVTRQNIQEVTNEAFLTELSQKGFKAAIFVEYVPVDENAGDLTLTETERTYLAEKIDDYRSRCSEMVLISFPGDEGSSGGCLAAGRGFFHINARGGAEPCPFSPYSDTSLREVSLRDALKSPLFLKLKSRDILLRSHEGGCVLHEQEETVKQLLLT